jgi:GAF domain-containing protein
MAQSLALVADVCDVPMAAVKLLGPASARFAATRGLPTVGPAPRSGCLCELVALAQAGVVVADARTDPRLAGHPLVAGPAGVRFIAAAPLMAEHYPVGALCVFDTEPRPHTDGHLGRVLAALARRLDAETTLRMALAERQPRRTEESGWDEFAAEVSHEVRTPLTSIIGRLEVLRDTPGAVAPPYSHHVEAIMRNADLLYRTVDHLLHYRPSPGLDTAATPG